MSELHVEGLVKRFGSNLVVDNISFHVQEGEFFVLLGPSGGGKSTTLRMICGLETPDAGRITLGTQDITTLAPRLRNLGMVFQDYGLYPSMNVFNNVAYGLEAKHMPRNEIDKRVRQAVELLGLTPHLHRSINDLSGGEQQRVALARILAKDAELFLFDEPLSNLDPKLRYQARRDILNVHRTKKKPSIYVTHDQTEAFAMADRIAVIAKGHLQQVGTSEELINAPANVFMARFIGSPPMNIIPGQLSNRGGTYTVQVGGLEIPLSARWNSVLQRYNQPNILLGIPPTAVAPQWDFAALEGHKTELSAEVLDSEVLIGEIITTLKVGNDITIKGHFSEPDQNLPQDVEWIKVALKTEELSLFDPSSELAIKAE